MFFSLLLEHAKWNNDSMTHSSQKLWSVMVHKILLHKVTLQSYRCTLFTHVQSPSGYLLRTMVATSIVSWLRFKLIPYDNDKHTISPIGRWFSSICLLQDSEDLWNKMCGLSFFYVFVCTSPTKLLLDSTRDERYRDVHWYCAFPVQICTALKQLLTSFAGTYTLSL